MVRRWEGSLLLALVLTLLSLAPGSPSAPEAVGYPCRDDDFDVLPGFVDPSPGYGEVAFYWWMGDPLTKERLSWQLDQLQNTGVAVPAKGYFYPPQVGGRLLPIFERAK